MRRSSKKKKKTETQGRGAAVRALRRLFERNGYVRLPNPKKRKRYGAEYKKGYEVRLVAETKAELREIRRLLKEAEFKVSRSFEKNYRYVQPVYGHDAVERFLRKKL